MVRRGIVGRNIYHMPEVVATRKSLTKLSIETNPGFLQWGVDKRYLLLYLADLGKSTIRKRTAQERDIDGEYFTRYREHQSAQRDQSDQIIRDARGRWTWIQDRGPDDPVYLRSNHDVEASKRMIQNVKVSPKNPRPDVHSIFIKPQGGRSGVGHPLRAWTTHYGSARNWKFDERPFMGLSDFDWNFILGNIRKDHLLAFVERTKAKWKAANAAMRDKNLKRARRKKERQQKRTAQAMKRAEAGASANQQRHIAYLKRMGVIQEDGESLRDALKRASGERRAAKRQRQRKRKGHTTWTGPIWNLTAAGTEEVRGRRATRSKREKLGPKGYTL